jgi:hypothetical protein
VHLSLNLTRYHAINTYAMLNSVPCHKDVWASGGIASRILNIGSKWRTGQHHAPAALPPDKEPAVATGYEAGLSLESVCM